MVHRAQDNRLLIALLKAEKDYSTCLTGLLTASQASFAALSAYGASCPPGQAQAVTSVIGALTGAEDALRKYAGVVDGWRGHLKQVKKSEEEVASIMRDREILIGRLVKATSKRTSRDSVLGVSLSSSTTTTVQEPNSSTATLGGNAPAAATGGNVKLSHAQAELQACEAHLALKEQDLERVRVRALMGGLKRRCKALVECGWIWGEKGKEALHALEMSSLNLNPNLNLNQDDKAPNGLAKLRRATKSPVASEMSSVTPSQSASQILPGSDSSADRPNRVVFEEPAGPFSIDIPAAHSIDDHNAVHDNIPSSRLVVGDVKQKAEGSDSDEGGNLEVHQNKPFAHTPRDASRVVSDKRYMHTRHPSTGSSTTKPGSVLRVPPPHQSNIRLHKSKPVSDLGPSPAFKSVDAIGMPYSRTTTSSGSLLGTITGLFKHKRASVEYNAVYTGPTAVSFANGWPSRTDRNLVRSRAQLSSSEEDLPSSVKRRSRASRREEELTPKPTHMERPPDKGKGRAAPMSITRSTSADSYVPNMSLDRTSTRSRETAANTALNSRTNGGGFSHHEAQAPVGRVESKRSATSSGTASTRRRESQPSSSLNMGEVTRQRGGGWSNGGGSGGGGGLVLPPAKLEVVRAPPSVTQAPVLTGPSPSPLVLPSTRKATSGPGPRGVASPPPRQGTKDSVVSYLHAPTSPRRGAAYTKTANGGSPRPLKPALRVHSLSPSPSPAPAIHGSVSSSTPSPSRTPTMPTGAIRLPEIHAPIPRPPPSRPMSLGVLPRKNRLSDIPASNRTSIVSENEYETCVEDFVDAEEGTESDTPPAALTPPILVPEEPAQSPPIGEPQKLLTPQRTLANGSPSVDASVSSTSTAQRKSVRMIIHPTVTVSAPEEYTDPPTPPAYDKGKEYEWYKSHSRSTSGSGTSQRSEVSRTAVPSAWETRVEHQRSVWENSEPEDEDYRAAKSALQRASAL